MSKVGTCMVFKVKTFRAHFFTGCFGFSTRVQFFQYPSVFAQDVINVPHYIIAIAIELVIIIIAAKVITEFFIGPAMYGRAAIKAKFFRVHCLKV